MFVVILVLTATVHNTLGQLSEKERICLKNEDIYSKLDDACHQATSQGPCEDGEWFVLTRGANEGSCQIRSCPNKKMVEVDGKCTWLNDGRVCEGQGGKLYTNMYGLGECLCREGFYKHSDGRCYQQFTKGWCSDGKILLKLSDLGDEKECRTVNSTDAERRNNAPCIFPFRYKGKTYDGCTSVDSADGILWCSTKVDADGGHMINSGEWGHCSGHCPATGFPSLTLNGIIDENEINALLVIDLVKVRNMEKLVCRDNPCGNPDLKTLWYDGNCHDIWENLDDCIMALNEKPEYAVEEDDEYYEDYKDDIFNEEIEDPSIDKLICEVKEIVTFSVSNIRKKQKCKKGEEWSKRLKECKKNPLLG